MRLSEIRIESGHYLVNGYTILKGGDRMWQVREMDDMIDYTSTLRQAIRLAESFRTGQDREEA